MNKTILFAKIPAIVALAFLLFTATPGFAEEPALSATEQFYATGEIWEKTGNYRVFT
jgi:hypothetical protein